MNGKETGLNLDSLKVRQMDGLPNNNRLQAFFRREGYVSHTSGEV
jgi:hypothetical protein